MLIFIGQLQIRRTSIDRIVLLRAFAHSDCLANVTVWEALSAIYRLAVIHTDQVASLVSGLIELPPMGVSFEPIHLGSLQVFLCPIFALRILKLGVGICLPS